MEKIYIAKLNNLVSILKILVAIVVIYVFQACNHKHNEKTAVKYSRTQQRLFVLLDEYDSEFSFLSSQDQKDSVQKEYLMKFDSFLKDSLDRRIDSMLVTVDTITEKTLLVITRFHSKQIEFKFGLRFLKKMDAKYQSIYNFYMSLKPGEQILINFIPLGEIKLGLPVDSNELTPTLIISAVPEPTEAQLAGSRASSTKNPR